MTLKIVLRILAVIAIILTIFPFVPVDHWLIRVFDFPHVQLTLLTMIALLTYFLKFNIREYLDYSFVVALTSCFLFQVQKVYPYTAFANYEVQNGDEGAPAVLKIYAANVLQDNKEVEKLMADMEGYDADIVLLTETNTTWRDKIAPGIRPKYPYFFEVPLENTYGMLLYSKIELYDTSVKYMVEDTIPSIHAKIVLEKNDTIQLYSIHPAPPTPGHNPTSVDRDAEMMKIAIMTRESELPVIVFGDFNDVAWSETSALFQSVSGLLDLRKGRGLFSTFNANNWLLRWPLDHIFISPAFRVLEVQRGKHIGSDHFPFFTKLSYEPRGAHEQELPAPTEEQLETAYKQIENEEEQKQQ